MRRYLKELRQALVHVESGRDDKAAEILAHLLDEINEPPRWSSPAQPPEDMGAWHWVWLAHSGLTGQTGAEIVSPELALQTAIDLLEG